MARGRRPNLSLEPSRQLLTQRAFRERKAAHLKSLEDSVKRLEMQNSALQRALHARGGAADAATIAAMDPSSTDSDHKASSEEGEEEKSSKLSKWLGNIHDADGAPLLRDSKEHHCANCVATKRTIDEIHAAVAAVATFANAFSQLRSILPTPNTDADSNSPSSGGGSIAPNNHYSISQDHHRQGLIPGTSNSLIPPDGPQRAVSFGGINYNGAPRAAPSPAPTVASGSRPQLSLANLSTARENVHPYARPRSSSGQPMGRATALLALMRGPEGAPSPSEVSYAHARSGSINSASSPYTPLLAAPALPLNTLLSPGAQQHSQSPWGFAPPLSPAARRASTAPGAGMGGLPDSNGAMYGNKAQSKPVGGCCGVPISESPCHDAPTSRVQAPRPTTSSSSSSGHGMLPPPMQQEQQQPFAQPTVHGELGMSTQQTQSEECCFGMFKCDSDGRLLL